MNERPIPSAEDRLLGVLRLERERLQNQDQGFAALLEEAAKVLRTLPQPGAWEKHGMRDWLPDELEGSALMLRARGRPA